MLRVGTVRSVVARVKFGSMALGMVIAATVSAAADETCGSSASPLSAAFVGHWAGEGGYVLEIGPTSWIHRWPNIKPGTGLAEYEEGKTFGDMAKDYLRPGGEKISCIEVTGEDVTRWVTGSWAEDSKPVALSLGKELPHPPYPAIHANLYEAEEFFMLIDANHAVDFWADEGDLLIWHMTRL